VDGTLFVVAVIAPGATLMVTAMVLMAGAAICRDVPSGPALRLFILGLGLLCLIPGVGILAATLLGRLMWPAALAGLVSILLGIGVLYGLRLRWAARGT
jgi:hypothetical protein